MGFFKEMKDDFSQAVNELVPDEMFDDDQVVNTLEETENIELSDTVKEQKSEDDLMNEMEDDVDTDILNAILTNEADSSDLAVAAEADSTMVQEETVKETEKSDEVTVITKGTTINGSISADGSLEVMGTIKGDVECQGKLSIIGTVAGNCMASEVFVGAKRLEGSINSEGSVKIGLGTVVIGDITASAAVIAGAVKGEIDINGPVIVDSSAVIKGNIKAQSIQINNGAVIEGFCSLSYAAIDIDNIFE